MKGKLPNYENFITSKYIPEKNGKKIEKVITIGESYRMYFKNDIKSLMKVDLGRVLRGIFIKKYFF